MSQLASLQSGFQAYLMDDERNTAFLAIVDDDKVGAKIRLKIYHDAYRFRIIEALAAAYPKLHALLGDDLFEKTARSYLGEYPSTYRNMRWYGHQMREHLLNTLTEHPIAAEMALFEWSLSLAFDAEDVPELKVQDLAQIPPENWGELRFKFQPAIQVVALRWNTILVWQALDVEQTPPKPAQSSSHTSWLIWRHHLNAQYRSMEEMEALALHTGITGGSFAEICEALFQRMDEDATMQAAQYLAGWLEAGLITELL
ncbi:MAG: HvfC/BufC family peptide modification chaperone [Methylophilaceae bacterium]